MNKILFIFGLLLSLSLQAAQVQDLYQVEVLVADQSHGERIKGMNAGIKEVLIRVSGSKSVVDNPELSAVMVAPERYVEGYRYEQRQQGADDLDFLLINFSAKALQRLLVDKGLPVWSAQRPDVLVWLAVEEHSRPYIVKDAPLNIVNQAMNTAAVGRGLPLLWPLDADVDAGTVRAADVKAGFVQEVSAASKDYSAHGILIGYVKRLPSGSWTGEWKFVHNGQVANWGGRATDLGGVMSVGVDAVADTLAAEFSILAGDEQGLLLVKIRNVTDLSGYAVTRDYLESLLITSDVAVVKVYANSVEYQLRLRSSAEEFLRAINLGGTMRLIPQVMGTNSIDPSLKKEGDDLRQPDYTLELIR